MILRRMLGIDGFEGDAGILMVLKMMLDSDDFEYDGGY